MGKGTDYYILTMFRIPHGLGPLRDHWCKWNVYVNYACRSLNVGSWTALSVLHPLSAFLVSIYNRYSVRFNTTQSALPLCLPHFLFVFSLTQLNHYVAIKCPFTISLFGEGCNFFFYNEVMWRPTYSNSIDLATYTPEDRKRVKSDVSPPL